jgi:hypothetical protein
VCLEHVERILKQADHKTMVDAATSFTSALSKFSPSKIIEAFEQQISDTDEQNGTFIEGWSPQTFKDLVCVCTSWAGLVKSCSGVDNSPKKLTSW